MRYSNGMTSQELKERRKKLGLRQDQLAERLGVARNTVSRWELNDVAIPAYLHLALKQIEEESRKEKAINDADCN